MKINQDKKIKKMSKEEIFKIRFNSFKSIYGETLTEDEIKSKVNWIMEKESHLSKHKNSINIYHYDFLISKKELEEIGKDLSKINVELGHYDQTGDVFKTIEISDIIIYLNNPVVMGVGINMLTGILMKIYKTIQGKIITKLIGNKRIDKKVIFEVKIKGSQNKSSSFKIKGDFNDEQIDKLINKISLISQKDDEREVNSPLNLAVTYRANSETGEWEEYNLLDEIKKARELKRLK